MTTTVNFDLDQLIKSSQSNFRVDVVDLAQRLNLKVYSVDLPDAQSGHICKTDTETYIEVNRNHPITRQRFTIAHEISHYLKHDEVLEKEGQLDRKTDYSNPEELKREEEADKTAANILMPEKLVKEYASKNSWTNLTRFNSNMIEKISEDFKVSRVMAITRLRELDFKIPFLTFA